MEIDHKRWANASEWLDDDQLADLTDTSPSRWKRDRDRGVGPPWVNHDGKPSCRRNDVEAWLIARSFRSLGGGGRA